VKLGLDERVALVTGSWRGTGAGIARVLAAEGAQVLVHGLEPGQAEPVAEQIRAGGGRAQALSGDVRSDEGAAQTAAAALAAAGRVDVLVNNYGTAEGGGWLDGPMRDWLDMYHINVLSGVRLVQALVPGMKQRGWGRVLFLSTVGSVRPRAQMPGYYAAKTALLALAVSLAKELAGTGITVNTVSPGVIATAEVRARLERRARQRGWGTSWEEISRAAAADFLPNPTGRIGTVEDVGYLVAFLASDLAGYINGSTLRIDGGASDAL
jgi:NAD(P)-dependent dehydrogenase (short-subunit alcohol dehydrogenase family)